MLPLNETTVGYFLNVVVVLTTKRGSVHRLRFTDGLDAQRILRWYRRHPLVASTSVEKY